jgi:hypothetical protein
MNNGDYSDKRNNCELGGAIFPKSASSPADAGCNSDRAQYSNTRSLRMPGVEEDDGDENEAHHELARNTEKRSANIFKLFESLAPTGGPA